SMRCFLSGAVGANENWKGLRLMSFVYPDRRNDNDAFDNLLVVRGHVKKVQPVVNTPHEECPQEFSTHSASPTREAGSPNHCSGDRIKFISNCRVRLTCGNA